MGCLHCCCCRRTPARPEPLPWRRRTLAPVRTISCSSSRGRGRPLRNLEPRQRDHTLPLDVKVQPHVCLQTLTPLNPADVGYEPGSLVQLDDGHVVWQPIGERRMVAPVVDDPAHQAAAAGRLLPAPLGREAARALGACRKPCVSTLRAALEDELASVERLPIGCRELRSLGRRESAYVPSTRVEWVCMIPPWLLTTTFLAPRTWFTDAPRSWRTASSTSCIPGMPVSESRPPLVLTGSSPPSSIRPPSTHLPPSPFRQKP